MNISTTPNPHFQSPAPPKHKPLTYHRLADVEAEEVKWLWYPYIPAGKLSLLEGDPGQGKSWITCALAADLSCGRALPGQKEALPPQKVLMLSAEDGLGDTIRPRIEGLAGNMNNIYVSDDYFILDPQGVKDLEDLMRTTAATIVFMDPIVAYMGGKIDMHRANEVRGLMTALAEAAKRTGTAVVAVRHLRKGGTDGKVGKAIYSGIGSIDFTAAVRSVMQVQESKSGNKYMYHAKHNLTPKGDALGYTFKDGHFEWTGPVGQEVLEEESKVSTRPKQVALAEQFLFDVLKSGPVSAITLHEQAAEHGISAQAIQRAKKGIAFSRRTSDGWVWYLEAREGLDLPVSSAKDARMVEEQLAALRARSGEDL